MDRRRFVKSLPVLPAGASAAGAALWVSGCASLRYLQPLEEEGRLTVRGADLAGSADALVRSATLPYPIYIREMADGGFSAVAAHCTHRGCQPEPEGDRLVCPCHGSEFSFTGGVLNGPAERSLDRFEVTSNGDDVIIWLSRPMRGGASS